MESTIVWDNVVKGFVLSKKLIRLRKNMEETLSETSEFKQILEEFHQVLRDSSETNSGMQEWLEDVEDLAYDIEDVLDVVDHEIRLRQKVKFSCISVLPMSLKLYYELSNQVQEITSRLETMNKRNMELRGNEVPENLVVSTGPLEGPDSTLYGRESEMELIIENLLRSNDGEQRYGIIPIVGMGGIGKTTLVKHVYNDDRVVSSFKAKAWACASRDFDVRRAHMTILAQLTGSCNVGDLSSVPLKLYRELQDKKFLIILDDLWEGTILEWNQFLAPFVDAAPGSKFIVSTRNFALAEMISKEENIVGLDRLSDEDIWRLFSRHSGLETNTSSQSELVNIGKQISQKVRGEPLAAIVIGSLLRGKEIEEWRAVMIDTSLMSTTGYLYSGFIIKKSYDSLPPCVQRCFALCTIFPEDFVFYRKELVNLWMSAGLIKGVTDWERLGNSYFDKLVARCFLLPKDEQSYVMHDMIRYVGQAVGGGSRYKYYDQISSVSWEKARHLSAYQIVTIKRDQQKVLPLRTLRVVGKFIPQKYMNTLLLRFRKLRVLSMEDLKIQRVSKHLGEMRHLRYLRFHSCEELEEIPSEIGGLCRLSYLDIWDCPGLTHLPSEIGNLSSLSQLQISGCPGLTQLPSEIGSLSTLSYLEIILCSGLTQLPSEIGSLTSLSKLCIRDCERLTQLPPEIAAMECLSLERCPRLTELSAAMRRKLTDPERKDNLINQCRPIYDQIVHYF